MVIGRLQTQSDNKEKHVLLFAIGGYTEHL